MEKFTRVYSFDSPKPLTKDQVHFETNICQFKLDIFLIQNQFQQEFLDPPKPLTKDQVHFEANICQFKLDIFLIQNQFQQEFLDPPNTMFKTTNIGSFIRQLNLYGFRKLNVVRFAETTPDMREVHEFQNDFFHRGRPDLLAYLKRNVGIRRTRDLAVKRRLETMESGSAAKLPRYAPQVSLSAPSFFITFGLLFRWSES